MIKLNLSYNVCVIIKSRFSINYSKTKKIIFIFYFLDGVITQYPVPKIPISNIVDSNGAGDAFIGGKISFEKQKNQFILYIGILKNIIFVGFISKYILECPIKTCIEAGINAGSYIIQQPGMTKGDSFKI